MERKRGSARMAWALVASLLVHAILLPAIFRAWTKNLTVSAEPRETVIASTAVRIEQRPVPRPPTNPAAATRPPATPTETRAAVPPRPVATVQPLQKEPVRSQPSPLPESFQQELARQQEAFAQEVARLNQHQDPLNVASPAANPPATYRRTYFDAPGHRDRSEVLAILIPLRHWNAPGTSCYYVRYVAQYTNGGTEQGVIPWPVCYPAGDDAMAHPKYPHALPIPFPQRDYVLPPGTYLAPLLQSVYSRRPK